PAPADDARRNRRLGLGLSHVLRGHRSQLPRSPRRLGALVCPRRRRAPRVRSHDRQEVPDDAHALACPRDAALSSQAPGTPTRSAMTSWDKYTGKAPGWSDREYARPDAYLSHRAELIRSLGPSLGAGDIV